MNNLVIDLSNIFFRSLFIAGNYNKRSMTFDNKNELAQLMRKVATDTSYIIRQANSQRIIFSMDLGSWRKNIEIKENEGYKAQREKASHINWKNVYGIMNEFSEILDDKGFIVSKIKKAEGDDLIALWRDRLLFDEKQNVIIISGDKDLRQLVYKWENNNNNLFSVVFNPFKYGKSNKKLYVPAGFMTWLKEEDNGADIFDRKIDMDKEDFNNLISSEPVDIEEVDGDYVSVEKLFCGDKGDNIPAFYSWLSKNNNEVRITKSKFDKIVEVTGITNYKQALDNTDKLKELLEGFSGGELDINVKERIERQAKLVVLDSKLFPPTIIESFNTHADDMMKNKYVTANKFNMHSLLEGTSYISNNKGDYDSGGTESDIFRNTDNVTKELF